MCVCVCLSVCSCSNSSETTGPMDLKCRILLRNIVGSVGYIFEKFPRNTFCVINVLREQSQIPDLRELASILIDVFWRLRVFIFRKCSNPPILTFLSIKSPIFAAQRVITYHWKGNRITYVMSTSNDQNYDDFNNKNAKNWILEKSDASTIWNCGHLKILAFSDKR